MAVADKINELISDFELFDDWTDKYEYLISLGKDLPQMPEDKKCVDNIVKGCQSKVWLDAEKKGDLVYFYADSDAIISKGIIALLVGVYNGAKAEVILQSDFEFIQQIGLQEHLSPNRSNGLVSMVKKMKTYALALK